MGRIVRRLACLAALVIAGPACGDVPFKLLLPAHGATGIPLNPTYSWTVAPGATSYLLEVATDVNFGVIVVSRPGLTTLYDTPPTALASGLLHFWRVTAIKPAGNVVAMGSPALFTTLALPGPFSLTSPADAAINQSLTPLFTWTAASGVASYTVQIATDSGFMSLVVNQTGLLVTSFTPSTPLSTSQLYYWKVLAINASGPRTATGSPRTFTTLPPPPGSFTLTAPADLANPVSVTPTYTWTASAGAASYTLQVSTSSSFSTFVVNKTGLVGTSDTPTTWLAPSTLHYWRVKAVNAAATVDASNAPRSFTTGPPADLAVNQTSLSFTTVAGTNPAGQNFQITNSSGTTTPLRWSVSSDKPWLQVSAISGQTATETDVVSVTPIAAQTEAWTTVTSTTNAPAGRENFPLVWTGSEMIVWGGSIGAGPSNDGGCYDPATDTWTRTTSPVGAPSARIAHTTVWTGTKMLVWGGRNGGTFYNEGFLYDPRTDTWSGPISSVNAPTPRLLHSAVWTGTEMIVWGGNDGSIVANGGRYNPTTNTWTTMSNTSPASARQDHFAVWTGTEMLIWGGENGPRINTGKRYNPTTDTWGSAITTSNAPTGRAGGASAWTGSEFLVWGGISNEEFISQIGGRYDPVLDTWQTTTMTNVLSKRRSDAAVWVNGEAIIWGGYSEAEGHLNTGKRYRPPIALAAGVYTGTITIVDPDATNSPRTINVTLTVTPAPPPPQADLGVDLATLSYTTSAGVNPPGQNLQITNSAGATTTLRWSASSDRPWLQHSALSGTTMTETDTLSVTPIVTQAEAWTTATSTTNAPAGRENFPLIWTGSEMIVWGGSIGGGPTNDGACYDPATDTWTRITTTTGAPTARIAHTAIWMGTRMLIWGGRNGGTYYGEGYLYDPRTDTWSGPISSVNAPSPRVLHSAVWTGTEMIVWGGYDGSVLGDGGRYNPTTNTWTTISTTSPPTARDDHFAVWTGTEMLIWGGEDGGGRLNTGKKYNPGTDTWGAAITTTGAPTGRAGGASTWTGSQMLVWGGISNEEFISQIGGLYDPVGDSWQATTMTNVLSKRRSDAAIWVNGEAIIWGGYSEVEGHLNTGKRYRPPIALAVGVHTGTLTIVDPDATNSPRTVAVTVTVTP